MAEVTKITTDTFAEEVLSSPIPVLVDFWGPRCGPCIQLDPYVEELAASYAGRVKLVKVVAPENRPLCIQLKVMSLPTFLAFKDGAEVQRVTSSVTREVVRGLVEELAGDAVAARTA